MQMLISLLWASSADWFGVFPRTLGITKILLCTNITNMGESLSQFVKNLMHHTKVLEFIYRAINRVRGSLENFIQQVFESGRSF